MNIIRFRLFFASCLFLLNGACTSLFYYPSREQYYDPQDFLLEPQDLWIDVTPTQKVHTWYFKTMTDEDLGTFVFFHGNAENMTSHFTMLSWLPFRGYNYLIFDYPGYGDSPGTMRLGPAVESGMAAMQYVHEKLDPRPLIIYGQSLGGALALKAVKNLSSQVPLKALVIDSSFNSYGKQGQRLLAKTWLFWPIQYLAYVLINPLQDPGDLGELPSVPIAFLAGDHDRVVDYRFSLEMYDQVRSKKQIWIVKGGRHGTSFESEGRKYRELLLRFLKENSAN